MKKLVALTLCSVFLLLTVPSLNFAEKKATKAASILLMNQPVQLLTTMFPFLNPIFVGTKAKGPSLGIVRPTGDISIGRPGIGD